MTPLLIYSLEKMLLLTASILIERNLQWIISDLSAWSSLSLSLSISPLSIPHLLNIVGILGRNLKIIKSRKKFIGLTRVHGFFQSKIMIWCWVIESRISFDDRLLWQSFLVKCCFWSLSFDSGKKKIPKSEQKTAPADHHDPEIWWEISCSFVGPSSQE